MLLLGFALVDVVSKSLGWFLPVEYLAAAGIAGLAAYGVALKVFAGAEGVPTGKRDDAARLVTTLLVLLGVAWLIAHGGGTNSGDY